MPPTELREFQDEKTGQRVKQLTSRGNNVHLYFTENAFIRGTQDLIFLSDRDSGEDKLPHQDPLYNLYRLNYSSGEITQLTFETESVGRATKTPDGQLLAYVAGEALKCLNTQTGEVTLLYEQQEGFTLTSPTISPDRRYVAFSRNEDVKLPNGPNYSGFAERFYHVKDGRVTLAKIDGTGWFDVWKDTHQITHTQFGPTRSDLVMFCHEGPWHLVTQRIWLLDLVTRDVVPCIRQGAEDAIGHEFWTQRGEIFFDNRGLGHDGTITSDKSQAVETGVKVNENTFTPYVGIADDEGNPVRRIDLPYYCNHYHANPDSSVLVGDDVDDLVLIDISSAATVTKLCSHGTSWHTQDSHCHPTWSWDGQHILYASDRGGKVNLYLLEKPLAG